MAKENDIITKIFLNDEQAVNKLEELEKKMKTLRKQREEAFKINDMPGLKKLNDEIKKTQHEMDSVKLSGEQINKTLSSLSTATVKDLQRTIAAINAELKSGRVTRNSEEWKYLNSQLKQSREELQKIRKESQAAAKDASFFEKTANFMNKNWGAITQTIAAYAGLHSIMKGCVDDFAQMDQAMADVRKYTGQSTEEVEQMNEQFKKMDTRTPREQLNELAGSAGRLGITSTPAILEFVDAADKINVALGDDLGKGAVDSIGKLAMAFGEDDKMGLRGAMLATGSAINDLAQNSAANAGYLVEFAARLSGVGVQAGLTQSQILGIAAAMDENMQKDEMAATAISQIITKMTTDSAVFAHIAGKNVEDFSKLVKTDMNAALMQFFESMNKKGGFAELAPLFEQMGLDGTRAIGVLSTLASKVDDVRRHQELATEAYQQGTSVLEEYGIQNDTYQAKLEKARKACSDLRIELGGKLLPVASVAISTTSMMVRVLSVLTDFVINNWKVLTVLTSGVVTYTAAVKLAALWDERHTAGTVIKNTVDKVSAALTATKTAALAAYGTMVDLVTGKVSLATVAQNLWNKIILSNPYVLVAAAVMTLVAAITSFISSADDATAAQKRLNEAMKEAKSTTEGERAELDALVETAKNKALADDTRREALRKLKEKYPDYLQNLRLEEINSQKAKDAIDSLTQSLIEEAKARILVRKIQEAEEKKEELDEKYFSGISGFWQSLVASFGAGVNDIADKSERLFNVIKYQSADAWNMQTWIEEQGLAINSAQYLWNNYKTEVAEADEEIKGLNDSLKKSVTISSQLKANNPLNTTVGDGSSDTTSSDFDTKSYWEEQLKTRREKLKALRDDVKATAADIEKASQEVKEAESKLETFTGAKAGAKTDAKQLREQEKNRRFFERQANDAAKAETEQQLAELTHRYAMGKILYCDYIDEQERIQLEGIKRRMLIYSTESLEYQKLNRQREELLLNGSEESRKLTQQQMKQDHEQRLAIIEEQAWRENMTEHEKNEMIFLEDMRFMDEQRILYRQGTLERINLEHEIEQRDQEHKLQSEQYYQQQLISIREQYLGKADNRVMELAIKNLDELHEKGKLSEVEYQEALLAIKAQYANYETNNEQDQRVGKNALKVAQDKAKQNIDNAGSSSASLPVVGDIMLYQSTMEQLKQMYQNDEITHAQYLAAKRQATGEFCDKFAQQMQAAYNTVNQVMNAASSYFSAQQEYEVALVQKKYEKQIEAAGNNQKKVKKLQEKQQKEEAAIKNKYNKKAMAIQVAQAMASTAFNAISAFGAILQKEQPWTVPLAYSAAAAATAAGMIQVAAIKKQQQAQEAGYYEGGFTGGRQYRREAGVVHEGEFVANHKAVQNQNILPFLQFLDQAQRNNTVGSLTKEDVSRQLGGSAAVVAPVVNVTTDNAELHETITVMNAAIGRLNGILENGIDASVYIDGEDGVAKQLSRYNKMKSLK